MAALVVAMVMQAAGVEPPLKPLRNLTQQSCTLAAEDEVLVCGSAQDRYRLPLPTQRERPEADGDETGPVLGSGLAAITPSGRCGLFAGERRCGKGEAARYGYGNGRNPLSMLKKLGKRLADADAELPDVTSANP